MALDLSTLVRLDDGALVSRTRAGERKAFSVLVKRHQDAVYRTCYRILGSKEDAEDAAQEAFIRAYKKLDSFQGRSAFKTWMLRLAINVSLNEHARRREAPLKDMLPEPTLGPEDQAIKSEAASRLHEALRLVQSNHRAAVVLHDLEGLTYEESAASLGVPEGTVKSWVHRGRKRLKDILA